MEAYLCGLRERDEEGEIKLHDVNELEDAAHGLSEAIKSSVVTFLSRVSVEKASSDVDPEPHEEVPENE